MAAAPAAIHVGMVDVGAGEGTGTGGGDDVGRGREVVLGATVEPAVVDIEAVVEVIKLELESGAGAADDDGAGAADINISTALNVWPGFTILEPPPNIAIP